MLTLIEVENLISYHFQTTTKKVKAKALLRPIVMISNKIYILLLSHQLVLLINNILNLRLLLSNIIKTSAKCSLMLLVKILFIYTTNILLLLHINLIPFHNQVLLPIITLIIVIRIQILMKL